MVDHELNELRREFLDEAREKVAEIHSAMNELQNAEALDRLAYLAHQLKGSGGSYGYQGISDDAAEIEKAAESLARADGDRSLLERKAQEHAVHLREEVERAAAQLA